MSQKLEAKIYDKTGKEAGEVTLPESVFGVSWNPNVVHEVVVSMRANARNNVAHTKDRSEVRGADKKPWRQKGTGRARHGSRYSPIWRGGGITFGPRKERDFSKKINQKTRRKALAMVLSKKYEEGEVVFVDSFSLSKPKTKKARMFLEAISRGNDMETVFEKRNAALLVYPEPSEAIKKSFRNINNVALQEARSLNPVDVLQYKRVVIVEPKNSVEVFEERIGGKGKRNGKEEAASKKTQKKKAKAKKKTSKKEVSASAK